MAVQAAQEDRSMAEWIDLKTAPKDGSEFLARCIRRYPFSAVPTYFPDIAKWSGKTPDDRLGHFASRRGDIVTHWSPIPPLDGVDSVDGSRKG